MRLKAIAIASVFAAATSGCSAGKELDEAERQVQRFHEQFNAARFATIYDGSAPALKQTGTAPDFVRLMEGLRKKLGPVQSSERQGFKVNFGTAGTEVTLSFRTRFAAGSGVENFVYFGSGASKRLAGYHVNSDVLATP